MKIFRAGKAIFIVAAAAVAAVSAGAFSPTKGAKASADKTFMTKAAIGGIAEVELGQLAVKKASDSAIKDFGQKMVDDHSKANDELKSLASSKGVTLPADTDTKNKAIINKLSKLNGAAFDKAYISDMVKDHKEDVAEFKKEAAKGKDADTKSWAGKTLPTLEMHLKMAQDTAKALSSHSSKMKKM